MSNDRPIEFFRIMSANFQTFPVLSEFVTVATDQQSQEMVAGAKAAGSPLNAMYNKLSPQQQQISKDLSTGATCNIHLYPVMEF